MQTSRTGLLPWLSRVPRRRCAATVPSQLPALPAAGPGAVTVAHGRHLLARPAPTALAELSVVRWLQQSRAASSAAAGGSGTWAGADPGATRVASAAAGAEHTHGQEVNHAALPCRMLHGVTSRRPTHARTRPPTLSAPSLGRVYSPIGRFPGPHHARQTDRLPRVFLFDGIHLTLPLHRPLAVTQPPVVYRSIVTVDPMVPVEQLDWRVIAAQSKSADSEVASAACDRAIEVRKAVFFGGAGVIFLSPTKLFSLRSDPR